MEEAGLRRVGEAGVLGVEADALEAREMEVRPARYCWPRHLPRISNPRLLSLKASYDVG